MAKNFWENDDLVQPSQPEKAPWEADEVYVEPKSFGQQLLEGEGPDIKKPKKTTSVLEGTTLTPEEQAAPATGPSLDEVIGQIKERDPETYLRAARKAELEEKTRQYEEEVPFLQRQTDPLMAGIARIPGIIPGIDVTSIQKQINEIREGKAGHRDPISGKITPFTEEEAENAIRILQEKQAVAQKKLMESQVEAGKYRKRPVAEAIGNVKTAREAFDAFQVDPFGVMASVSLESAPQMVPALVLGAVTRNPTVGALAMGSTSFATELSSGVTEYFQDKGININDPVAVNKALNDPVMFAKAYEHALTRASIIGAADTASAGLASKLLVPKQVVKNQLAREAINVGVAQPAAQMISGGGGEALAQIATEGSVTKPGQVFLEAVGEGPTSILETAAFGGEKAVERLRGQKPEPTLTDVRVPPVPEGMDPELHARASMKLDAIISQADQTGTINKRELNKLARDLEITPSKDANDTVSAVYNALYPEVAEAPAVETEVPAMEAEAPAVEQALPPEVEQEIAAAEAEAPPEKKPFFDEIRNELKQKTQAIRDAYSQLRPPKEAKPEEEPSVPTTVKEFDEAEFEAPQEAPVVPQATEVVKEEVEPKKESEFDISKAATAAVDSMYQAIFDAQQQGKTKVAGIEDSVLRAAKNEGIVFQTPQEVQDFANTNESKIKAAANQIRQEKLKSQAEAAKTSKEEVAEKKMLDAIEDIKKTKGTANQFIAKYGKPMFDRANAEGYIQNEANDQRLFSTLKLDELWSKYNKPEEYAAMMKRREASEKERQAEQAKIAEEAKPVEQLKDTVSEEEMSEVHDAQRVGKGLDVVPEDMMHFKLNKGINNSGKFQFAAEHIGDLVHRLSSTNKNQGGGHKYGIDAGIDKASRRYDFDDMLAQVRRNAESAVKEKEYQSVEAFEKEFKDAAKKYAEAYKKIPVYTEFQRLGRDAAIALGELRFDDTKKLLKELTDKLNQPDVEEKYFKKEKKPRDMGTEAYPFAKPQVSKNKVFTDDAAEKARALLKSKLNQLNSGIDPEVLQAGIILSGYHVEKGARTFAAYSAAMIKDLGNAVKPYLKSWYMALKYDPRSEEFKDEMDSADTVDKFEFEKTSEYPDLMTPEGKFEVAKRVSDALLSGAQYDNIAAARQFIKGIIGRTVNPGTAEAKEADEAIEVGVVMAARSIVDERNSPQETYDKLVDLYNRQPSLSVRSSESVAQQAYSTPAPLAYIASQLAGIDKKTTVLEPTAGNGMLLIGADPKKVMANELNATRLEMLKRVLPGAEIDNRNAAFNNMPVAASSMDVVIANPPFGTFKDKEGKQLKQLPSSNLNFKVSSILVPYESGEIDHVISFMALNHMKEDGRAVLIVGGVRASTEEGKKEGYRGKAKRLFYSYLYNQYNVVDHFTVEGDLYKKQGAGYPVDVIVINGKGKSERKLPAADLPKVYSSYEQLKEKLDEASRMESKPSSIARVDSGDGATRASESKVLDTGAGKPSAETGEARAESRGGAKESVSTTENIRRTETEPSGAGVGRKEPRAENLPKLEQPRKEPVSSQGEGVGSRVGTSDQRSETTGLGKPSGSPNERIRPVVKEEETQYQITYRPKSKLKSVETLMPKGMADAIRRSLDRLEQKVGDIDAYVANSLGMDLDTLGDYFSAEQSDALALAINNAEKGKGFIIGDQTGIGKGRVVAGMIRYALANDKVPIFVTEKGNLYADMVRDLAAIGMADDLNLFSNDQKILITNASSKDKIPYTFVVNENGKKVEKDYILQSPKKGQAMNKLLDSMAKDGNIGDFKVIFTTYDQMKTVKKGQTTSRREFLRALADNNYVILDESHTAGGTGTPDPKKENVAKFARVLIASSYGSFYSSATYAKRANVMDLYASTDMSLAVENMEELGEAIQRGGVPMQQVVATMLAEAGQYIRREKSFEGITYETKEVSINKEIAENMATTLRNVLSFSSAKEAVVDEMQAIEDESGGIIAGGDLIKSEVEGDNFGATMHNLIGQMLLGLKAEQAANYAVERIKQGEKVVLTVSNTMGSFLNEFADDMGLSKGDAIDLTFKDLFLKYLNKQRIVKVKNDAGEAPEYIDGVKEVYLTDEMLGPKLTESFNKIKAQIENADYGTAPISPIDYMQSIIKKAGYRSSEITGRNLILDYTAPVLILDSRDSGITARLDAIKQFNNADLNAMVLNKAGSTGLSLHSSADFINQSKRHMIIVQADPDIAIHMQMLGRVNRTGQVNKPAYTQLGGDIPAENRPMAVLAKKMASLNANTTAGQKSAVTAENVVDFVNEYGGQVAQEFLADNPWFNETIGNRIKVTQDATEGTEDDIRKLTGYIPVFPIKQQEEIYQDLLDRYTSLIDLVNSMGTNKLEAKAMDLDAKTLSSKQITEDKGDSPFAKPAYMEQIDVKRTVKPLSSKEVQEIVSKSLDGRQPAEVNRQLKTELREKVSEYAAKKKAEMLEKETDPIRINQFEKQTELTESHISTILNMYKIGDSISLKDPEGIFTYGVITNISTSGKTANPAAGSAWKMNIALANGEVKSLSLNFSQIGTASGFTLSVENMVDYLDLQTGQGKRMRIMDIFDAASGERREKRWMVTGNLLAGYAQYPGQIVFYRKDDGSVGQGILMSRLFDFEKALKDAPVRIKSVGQAMRFFEEIGGVIGADDNNLRIEKSGRSYYFITPKSKRQGGIYFQDEGLIKYTGTFYSSGSNMRAVIHDDASAEKAIQHLIDSGKKLLVKTGVEKARVMFAPPKLENIEEKQLSEMAIADRKETIKEYSKTRRSTRRLVKQVAKYGSDIAMQRQLNEMLAHEENLKNYIDSTKTPNMTAEAFMAEATDALRDGRITPEVERFVRSVYEQYPSILNGIKLSVRKKEGKGQTTGNFDPITRLVSLWTKTSGVRTSKTVRHELTHTMEQMMTPEVKKALVAAWARNLEAGIKKYKDKDSQKYFEAVLKFLENPTEETSRDATNIMPDYSYYQYLNPSEYWAVNAEKLFGQQLGGAWTRFVKAMEKMLEALKAMFFMNNKLAVHRAFDQIIKKQPTRETRDSLMEYLMGAKIPTRLLNQIEEDKNLVDDLGIPDVPNRDSQTMKDYLLTKFSSMHNKAKEVKVDPMGSMQDVLHQSFDKATMQRIKNIDYTAGLAKRDAARWEGQIRTANGELIPIVAVLNNLRSGHLANAVLVHGKLEYSGKFGQFIAVDSEESMGNVIRLQDRLRRRLTKPVADKLINAWFIAMRTRGIQEDYFNTSAEVRELQEQLLANTDSTKTADIEAALAEALQDLANIKLAYQKVPYYFTVYNGFITKKIKGEDVRIPDVQYDQDGLPILDDSALDSVIERSKAHPELQQMMDNWTAVNHNMLDNLAFSGRISKPRAEKLKKIKNYSPWYRVMEESEDIYDAKQISGASSGPMHFKAGRTERDVDNVVESMMHNVAMFTRSTLKNYAQYRVAMEYAQRRPDTVDPKTGKTKRGRILVFDGKPRVDEDGAKVPIYIGGRRMLINIPDTLVADAYIGMSVVPWDFPFKEILSAAAQLSRRTITFSGIFQLRQVFYDSWSTALKSGTKHPWRLFGATFTGFARSLEIGKQDKTVQILKRAAVGGFRSHHRAPDLELKVEVGLLTNDNWQTLMSSIDAIGDASDYASRVATYDRILKESGDPALALFMSSQIMDFGKHGKGMIGQTLRSTVTFMQAWATDLDTLAQTAMGGAVTGKEKKKLKAQFRKTMLNFVILAIAYTLLAGLDPDYDELDDQTKARNFYVPFSKKATGQHVLVPLNNTAAFFFKVMPEMLINYTRKYGTEKEIDTTRAINSFFKSLVDSVLGPTPIPTGVKPTLEIVLDRNFFTGGTVVPKSLSSLESSEQFNASTSELAKIFGEYTGVSPVKTDHFIRGTFGTAGALAQWFSNMIFSEGRVASEFKQNPIVSSFVAPDVLKLNEQLFYDLRDRTNEAYKTWNDLMERENFEKADKYYEKNEKLIEAHGYIMSLEEELKDINKEIRRIGRTFDKSMSPEEKRKEINEFTRLKQEILSDIFAVRKEAGL